MSHLQINYSSDKQFWALIAEQCEWRSPEQMMRFFVNNGLLSHRRCRAFVVYYRVRELVAEGKYITEAMHLVAERLRCSFECARKDYYMFAKMVNDKAAD